MKKILSILLLAVITVGANAQKDSTNEVWFKIQKEGCFATEDGNDYIIYHQEGKTAKELFRGGSAYHRINNIRHRTPVEICNGNPAL